MSELEIRVEQLVKEVLNKEKIDGARCHTSEGNEYRINDLVYPITVLIVKIVKEGLNG